MRFPRRKSAALAAGARNREPVLGRLTAARPTLGLRHPAPVPFMTVSIFRFSCVDLR